MRSFLPVEPSFCDTRIADMRFRWLSQARYSTISTSSQLVWYRCEGWIRTTDLWVMSPASFHCSTSQFKTPVFTPGLSVHFGKNVAPLFGGAQARRRAATPSSSSPANLSVNLVPGGLLLYYNTNVIQKILITNLIERIFISNYKFSQLLLNCTQLVIV